MSLSVAEGHYKGHDRVSGQNKIAQIHKEVEELEDSDDVLPDVFTDDFQDGVPEKYWDKEEDTGVKLFNLHS
jgi:hypothetical protein